MADTPTVGGTLRGVVETVHSPVYPGGVLTLTADAAHAHRFGWDGNPGPCPRASAAALIARLTAGDAEPDAPHVVTAPGAGE